jgi:hypothetical protein
MKNSFQTPPPIEELSEISWKRIEQGLMTSLDSAEFKPATATTKKHPRILIPFAVACLAAAAVAFVALTSDNRSKPQVTENTSQIATQESPTSIVLQGAQLEVHPHSEVAVEQYGGELAFQLHDGGISLSVAPRDHKAPVTIVSGDVQIEVVGTKFSVYRSSGDTQVVVDEGIVAVSRAGARQLVRAGERWPFKEAADTPSVEVPKTEVPNTEVVTPAVAPVKSREPEQRDARDLFEEAADKEQSAPSEAIRLYRRAARGSGPWAANALFAQARLLVAQGNPDKAKPLLQRYLKRFPSGANTADARALLKGLN